MEVRNRLLQELRHHLHGASAGNVEACRHAGLSYPGAAIHVSAGVLLFSLLSQFILLA